MDQGSKGCHGGRQPRGSYGKSARRLIQVCRPFLGPIRRRCVVSVFVALAGLVIGNAAASTKEAAGAAPSVEYWRKKTDTDLAAFAAALRDNYIYAAYPDPEEWNRQFGQTLATVEAGLPLVQDEAGYQAVLQHLAATLQDSHVGIRFAQTPAQLSNWPGFLARFDGTSYRVASSRRSGISEGAEISSCDGRAMSWWVSKIARLEVGLPDTLEVSRNAVALRLFVDRGSPLRPRPVHCVIDNRSVRLDWTAASLKELGPLVRSWEGSSKPEASTRLVGSNGAWVRLGYFYPASAQQAKDFYAAIEAAPTLRDKRFIILDVRGNGGGPYNWFMAYLRGLYGEDYADHHATARLHVRGVYRLSPAYIELARAMKKVSMAYEEPADPPYEINELADAEIEGEAILAGKPLHRSTPLTLPERGPAPANPVTANVYVLTDYGCGSACIAFVDELKLFPGVRHIGLSTFVDSRSGTPIEVKLPSGQATVMVAAMTRDGRIRGDNVPQIPTVRFDGDIRDDEEVERWVLQHALFDE